MFPLRVIAVCRIVSFAVVHNVLFMMSKKLFAVSLLFRKTRVWSAAPGPLHAGRLRSGSPLGTHRVRLPDGLSVDQASTSDCSLGLNVLIRAGGALLGDRTLPRDRLRSTLRSKGGYA